MNLAKKAKFICAIFAIIVLFLLWNIGVSNAAYITDDVNGINDAAYPGIKSVLQQLKNEHPSWNFKLYYTGLDWNDVITNEYQGHGRSPKNLSPANNSYYDGEWICPYCGRTTYDSGSWYCASETAIRYMMDPRNSINAEDIFQFQDLSSADASRDNIATMVSGTFLDEDECIDAIIEASTTYNVNGYYLVARILQEQGSGGSYLSNGNGYYGNYEGVYNLFNIGAYGSGEYNVVMNGLEYADSEGWYSKADSIIGGAEFVAKSYIAIGQSTLYFQKFNVVTGNLYNHQYMQNILAAQNEGTKLRRTYTQIDGNLSGTYTFLIPMYDNMPAEACARPITQNFNSPELTEAVINANGGLKLREAPGIDPEMIGAVAEGATVKIVERAIEKIDGYYWDKIITNSGYYGYVAREASDGSKVYLLVNGEDYTRNNLPSAPSEKIKLEETNIKCSPNITVNDIKAKYSDAVFEDDIIATGKKVTINGKEYRIVKKGDVNGDGDTSVLDIIFILNYLRGNITFDDECYLEAAKLSNNAQEVSVLEIIVILNYLKGNIEL